MEELQDEINKVQCVLRLREGPPLPGGEGGGGGERDGFRAQALGDGRLLPSSDRLLSLRDWIKVLRASSASLILP